MINGKRRGQSISRDHSLGSPWRALVVIDLSTPCVGSGNASVWATYRDLQAVAKGAYREKQLLRVSEPWNPRVNLTSKAKHWVSEVCFFHSKV